MGDDKTKPITLPVARSFPGVEMTQREALEIIMSVYQQVAHFARVLSELQDVPPAHRAQLPPKTKDEIIDAVAALADAVKTLADTPGAAPDRNMARSMQALFIVGGMIDDMTTPGEQTMRGSA